MAASGGIATLGGNPESGVVKSGRGWGWLLLLHKRVQITVSIECCTLVVQQVSVALDSKTDWLSYPCKMLETSALR